MLFKILAPLYKWRIKKTLAKNQSAVNFLHTKGFQIVILSNDKLDFNPSLFTQIKSAPNKLGKDEVALENYIYPHHFNWLGVCNFKWNTKQVIWLDLSNDEDLDLKLFVAQQKGLKITSTRHPWSQYYSLKFAKTQSKNEIINLSLTYLKQFWNARA